MRLARIMVVMTALALGGCGGSDKKSVSADGGNDKEGGEGNGREGGKTGKRQSQPNHGDPSANEGPDGLPKDESSIEVKGRDSK